MAFIDLKEAFKFLRESRKLSGFGAVYCFLDVFGLYFKRMSYLESKVIEEVNVYWSFYGLIGSSDGVVVEQTSPQILSNPREANDSRLRAYDNNSATNVEFNRTAKLNEIYNPIQDLLIRSTKFGNVNTNQLTKKGEFKLLDLEVNYGVSQTTQFLNRNSSFANKIVEKIQVPIFKKNPVEFPVHSIYQSSSDNTFVLSPTGEQKGNERMSLATRGILNRWWLDELRERDLDSLGGDPMRFETNMTKDLVLLMLIRNVVELKNEITDSVFIINKNYDDTWRTNVRIFPWSGTNIDLAKESVFGRTVIRVPLGEEKVVAMLCKLMLSTNLFFSLGDGFDKEYVHTLSTLNLKDCQTLEQVHLIHPNPQYLQGVLNNTTSFDFTNKDNLDALMDYIVRWTGCEEDLAIADLWLQKSMLFFVIAQHGGKIHLPMQRIPTVFNIIESRKYGQTKIKNLTCLQQELNRFSFFDSFKNLLNLKCMETVNELSSDSYNNQRTYKNLPKVLDKMLINCKGISQLIKDYTVLPTHYYFDRFVNISDIRSMCDIYYNNAGTYKDSDILELYPVSLLSYLFLKERDNNLLSKLSVGVNLKISKQGLNFKSDSPYCDGIIKILLNGGGSVTNYTPLFNYNIPNPFSISVEQPEALAMLMIHPNNCFKINFISAQPKLTTNQHTPEKVSKVKSDQTIPQLIKRSVISSKVRSENAKELINSLRLTREDDKVFKDSFHLLEIILNDFLIMGIKIQIDTNTNQLVFDRSMLTLEQLEKSNDGLEMLRRLGLVLNLIGSDSPLIKPTKPTEHATTYDDNKLLQVLTSLENTDESVLSRGIPPHVSLADHEIRKTYLKESIGLRRPYTKEGLIDTPVLQKHRIYIKQKSKWVHDLISKGKYEHFKPFELPQLNMCWANSCYPAWLKGREDSKLEQEIFREIVEKYVIEANVREQGASIVQVINFINKYKLEADILFFENNRFFVYDTYHKNNKFGVFIHKGHSICIKYKEKVMNETFKLALLELFDLPSVTLELLGKRSIDPLIRAWILGSDYNFKRTVQKYLADRNYYDFLDQIVH